MARSFRRTDLDGDEVGRYKGNNPLQAAKKAFSVMARNGKVEVGEVAEITIRECTR